MLVHVQSQKPSVLPQGGPACADPQSAPTELPDLPPELQTAEHRRDAELGSLLDKLSGSIGRRQRVAARDQVGFPDALSAATGLSLLTFCKRLLAVQHLVVSQRNNMLCQDAAMAYRQQGSA